MTEIDEDMVEAAARAIYEADQESGYDADDPKTFWMAEDGYWPPADKMFIWDMWRSIARAALTAILPMLQAKERERAEEDRKAIRAMYEESGGPTEALRRAHKRFAAIRGDDDG